MIANPRHTFYMYNPYEQSFTLEEYDFKQMIYNRKSAIQSIPKKNAKIGIIFGLLGRQGSLLILEVILIEN